MPAPTQLIEPANPVPREELEEIRAWGPVAGGWRQLYGSFADRGFSVELHRFQPAADLDWRESFHPESLEICLNLAGQGTLRTEDDAEHRVEPGVAALYLPGPDITAASRPLGQKHEFCTFELSRGYLGAFLTGREHLLAPQIRHFLRPLDSKEKPASILVRPLTAAQTALARQLESPPGPEASRGLWYQAKLLELIAELGFTSADLADETFCQRQKRLSQERSDKVKAILRADLREPPNLDELGRQVGCSPYYLSRIFSQEVGVTIQQYLKQIRMERAAELLRAGRHNVTETALEVGYSSLSHFSKVFYETIGCCPGLYPNTQLFATSRRRPAPPGLATKTEKTLETS